MSRLRISLITLVSVGAVTMGCGRDAATPSAPSSQTVPAAGVAATDGSTLKVTAPTPVSPKDDQQATDAPVLTATTSAPKFAAPVPLQYRFEVYNEAGVKVEDSGLQSSTTYKVTSSLEFKKRYTWRVRSEYQGAAGPWSVEASFISAEGGYIRGNEVFDPLYNGITAGERIGPTTFVPDKGLRLEGFTSYVRYAIPQTITAGEFSMEVEGLRADGPGNKSKVFGMSSNGPDFILDPYRVDIQYRGVDGFPPNAITFRALYGSDSELDVRYEPDTNTRFNSVRILDPNTTYFWKFTWGSEVRLTVRQGGAKDNGPIIYDYGKPTPNGTYNPVPMYAFLGTPVGRSGVESASIPGAIFRNVWISSRPRP